MDKRVKDIIDKSGSVVFFGGAGVSTKAIYLISDPKRDFTAL